MSGHWVRRRHPEPHRCAVPQGSHGQPLGRLDDLWRCDCAKLWRIGRACALCEHYGAGNHGGQCKVGNAWHPATAWQRLTTCLRERRARA